MTVLQWFLPYLSSMKWGDSSCLEHSFKKCLKMIKTGPAVRGIHLVSPATLALASTWGPMEESPPLNSRRGRRDVYQGEQTPRGAPEANSVTPSSAVPSMTPPLGHWRPACARCWGLGADGPGPGPGASLGGLGPGVSPLDLCPVTLCA